MTEPRSDSDTAVRDALIATATELTKYLVEQRELEQKRWTRSLATTVFFLSMGLSYLGVHALSWHNPTAQPKRQPATDLQRVQISKQTSRPTADRS
jgi:hypothetical protein